MNLGGKVRGKVRSVYSGAGRIAPSGLPYSRSPERML